MANNRFGSFFHRDRALCLAVCNTRPRDVWFGFNYRGIRFFASWFLNIIAVGDKCDQEEMVKRDDNCFNSADRLRNFKFVFLGFVVMVFRGLPSPIQSPLVFSL